MYYQWIKYIHTYINGCTLFHYYWFGLQEKISLTNFSELSMTISHLSHSWLVQINSSRTILIRGKWISLEWVLVSHQKWRPSQIWKCNLFIRYLFHMIQFNSIMNSSCLTIYYSYKYIIWVPYILIPSLQCPNTATL